MTRTLKAVAIEQVRVAQDKIICDCCGHAQESDDGIILVNLEAATYSSNDCDQFDLCADCGENMIETMRDMRDKVIGNTLD
jgi:hypothetical protein